MSHFQAPFSGRYGMSQYQNALSQRMSQRDQRGGVVRIQEIVRHPVYPPRFSAALLARVTAFSSASTTDH